MKRTDRLQDLAADPTIDVVIEVIGGTDDAGLVVRQALSFGKAVVTANKALLADKGPQLERVARDARRRVRFEAAVAGGIPVLSPLVSDLASNQIEAVRGIVNGTTNHILSAMASDGRDYADVLAEAQERGYAEADPSGDVEGHDAANKLAVLTRLAFDAWPDVRRLRFCVPSVRGDAQPGITCVQTASSWRGAAELGLTIKLVARAEPGPDGSIRAAVTPVAVKATSPLGTTGGVTNLVEVVAEPVGSRLVPGARRGWPRDRVGGARGPARHLPRPAHLHLGPPAAGAGRPARHATTSTASAPGSSCCGDLLGAPMPAWLERDRAGRLGGRVRHPTHRPRRACAQAGTLGCRHAALSRHPGGLNPHAHERGAPAPPDRARHVRAAPPPDAAVRGVPAHHRRHAAAHRWARAPRRSSTPATWAAPMGAPLLHLKFEGMNPTGSFKDRGMVMAVAKALEAGARAIICASTGNTSASAAAYGAAAGLEVAVILPAGKIAAGKLLQAQAAGARVVAVDGNFDQALRVVRELAEQPSPDHPVTLVNSVNPYRLEGQKTAAFEICEDLGGAPDYLAIPVGNAGNISAYWMGFKEYRAAGLVETAPGDARLPGGGCRAARPGPPRGPSGDVRHGHPHRRPGVRGQGARARATSRAAASTRSPTRRSGTPTATSPATRASSASPRPRRPWRACASWSRRRHRPGRHDRVRAHGPRPQGPRHRGLAGPAGDRGARGDRRGPHRPRLVTRAACASVSGSAD